MDNAQITDRKKTMLCVAGLPTQAGPIRCSDLCVHQMAGAPHIYIPGSQSLVLDQPHHLHLGTNQKCKFSIPTPDLVNWKLRGRGVVIYVLPDPPTPLTPSQHAYPGDSDASWDLVYIRSIKLSSPKEKIYCTLYTVGSQTFDELIKWATKKTDVKRRASFATLDSLP